MPLSRRSLIAGAGGLLAAGAARAETPLAAPAGRRGADVLSVADSAFGSAGKGGDDADAFAACFAAAAQDGVKRVVIPPAAGGYMLGRTVIVPRQAANLEIVGSGYAGRVAVGFAGVGVHVQATMVTVAQVRFDSKRSPKGEAPSVALSFRKELNVDDTDSVVEGCAFFTFDTAIDHSGRGLRAERNTFALCTTAISLGWPDVVDATEGPLQGLPLGFRKFMLSNNHAHSVGCFAMNRSEAPLRGGQLNMNLLDVGRGFWAGPIAHSQMLGNMVQNCSRTPIYIPRGGDGMEITGRYGGLPEPAGGSDEVHQPENCVVFGDRQGVTNVRIDAQLNDVRDSLLKFGGGVSASEIAVLGSVSRRGTDAAPAAVTIAGSVLDSSIAARLAGADEAKGPLVRIGGDVERSVVNPQAPAGQVAVAGRIGKGSKVGIE